MGTLELASMSQQHLWPDSDEETPAGQSMTALQQVTQRGPGWLTLYLLHFACSSLSDESPGGTPRSCAISCLPAIDSTSYTSTPSCGNPVNVRLFQPGTTTQVQNIVRRVCKGRANRAKAAAGANVHVVKGEWRHLGGPYTIHPARSHCLPGKLFNSQA